MRTRKRERGRDTDRERTPERSSDTGGAQRSGGSSGGGSRRRARGRSSQRGRRDRQRRQQGPGRFWGDPAKLPDPPPDLRISDDPSAVARSLGPPPLPGHEAIAEHYFAAVYDRAVATAGALAAAGGLIDADTLHEELGS